MLIVLEGCDGTGKSSLSCLLAHVLSAKIIHATKETPNDYAWFSGIIERSKTENIIADRFFWGQFVYQSPEERKLTENELSELERELSFAGGILILVTAPTKVIKKRLEKRGEKLINGLTVKKVKHRFSNCAFSAWCPVAEYNTKNGKLDIEESILKERMFVRD